MPSPILIYCFDSYCMWSYAFNKTVKNILNKYPNLQFEAISVGLILPEQPTHINLIANYWKEHYVNVEESSDINFGADFLWHAKNPEDSDWFPDSLVPAKAFCILKSIFPDKQLEIIEKIQYALFYEGRDLTDPEAYNHICEAYQMDIEKFKLQLKSKLYENEAQEDFNTCKQLQVQGMPSLYLQNSEGKIYCLTKGFTDEILVMEKIEKVLATTA